MVAQGLKCMCHTGHSRGILSLLESSLRTSITLPPVPHIQAGMALPNFKGKRDMNPPLDWRVVRYQLVLKHVATVFGNTIFYDI